MEPRPNMHMYATCNCSSLAKIYMYILLGYSITIKEQKRDDLGE